MKNFLKLTDFSPAEIEEIFYLADKIAAGGYQDFLKGKSIILFFPGSSIRTRITFEKGIYLLGGQPILFPSETLDKKENLKDVCGYMNQWADMLIVRHKDMQMLEKIAMYSDVPIINAMTDVNHPCEIISDLYSLSKIRDNFRKDRYLFCGKSGNIGLAWKEASEVMDFEFAQCCGVGYEMEGVKIYHNAKEAVKGRDIICTDSLPFAVLDDFKECQITTQIMDMANPGAVLNPCPPFYRGEEVSEDVMDSRYFVGYGFKKHLLTMQQAVMVYCLQHEK